MSLCRSTATRRGTARTISYSDGTTTPKKWTSCPSLPRTGPAGYVVDHTQETGIVPILIPHRAMHQYRHLTMLVHSIVSPAAVDAQGTAGVQQVDLRPCQGIENLTCKPPPPLTWFGDDINPHKLERRLGFSLEWQLQFHNACGAGLLVDQPFHSHNAWGAGVWVGETAGGHPGRGVGCGAHGVGAAWVGRDGPRGLGIVPRPGRPVGRV
jgi:hypothetical protein